MTVMHKKYLLNAAVFVVAVCAVSNANADEGAIYFNIPSQPLSSALDAFSHKTQIQFDVDRTLLSGKTASAVEGTYSPQQALTRLLSKTDIYASEITSSKQVALAQSNTDDTIIVNHIQTHITRTMEIGSQQLDATSISKMPQTNNSITGLLKTNPNVQYSESSNTSTNPGEIAPETISFHGEKFYNNNFIVDGLSNNDRLNPGDNLSNSTNSPNGYKANDMPSGHPEAFWIPSQLVDSVSVFDSNVSAKYGQFTGGVVDAKLKEASFVESSGSVSWRTSRDAWVKYHIDDSQKETFEQASQLKNQPKFKKNFYSINLNQPLSDNAGLIFAYSRQESKIPYWQNILQKWDNQERLSETYLLKGTWQADSDNRYNLTLMYSPHSSTFVRKNVINSDFSVEGGGYNINWQWLNQNKWADVKTQIAWKNNENTIRDHTDFYTWKNSTPSIGWSSSGTNAQEGGYGDRETEQQGLNLKQDWDFNAFNLGNTLHQVSSGFDIDLSKAKYKRKNDSYSYSTPLVNSSVNCQGSLGCINGEQYASMRTVYAKENTSVKTNSYGLYLQDEISWSRLTLTPGIRFDYDDYMKNNNISPRLAAIYDVLGDHRTELFGGVNRYYAGNILAYKLREARKESYYEKRVRQSNGNLTDWAYWKNGSIIGNKYHYSSLDTPYSDEVNLGLRQQLFDTIWTAKWVYRKGKDQFSRSDKKDADGYYVMTNDGKSSSNTYTLTVEPVSPISWKLVNMSWLVGGSITRNHSSNDSYDDNADDETVMYKGKLTSKLGLPASNYNRPWTAFVELNTEIPDFHFDWTNRLSLVGPYRSLEKIGTVDCSVDSRCSGRGVYDEYGEVKYGDNISWDWRFTYTYPTFNKQNLVIGLDVINVLDRTNQLSKDSYTLGRQFWLDVAYTW